MGKSYSRRRRPQYGRTRQRSTRTEMKPRPKRIIEVMAENEGLGIRMTGEGERYLEYNIYSEGEGRSAINRIAAKLKRRGCSIHRFGDPNSIKVRVPRTP